MKGHATHNENACNLLHDHGGFPDWVVTTAFYSALHLVYERLFPLKVDGTSYADFDTYYSKLHARRPAADKPTKHEATVDLVKVYYPRAASYYRLLKDSCHNARYRNYQIPAYMATTAREQLQTIKGALTAKK